MYRRPKFLEVLHQIREEMSREADYDMDSFAEIVRNGDGKSPEEDRGQKEKGKNIEDAGQNFKDRSPKSRLRGLDRKLIYGNRF